jgi:hypothetical protein
MITSQNVQAFDSFIASLSHWSLVIGYDLLVQNAVLNCAFPQAGELTEPLYEAFTVGPDSQYRIKIRL